MDNNYSKLFGCNIHDSIRVSPMALKIINTPEFQRMRHIKQLALCCHVYPAATHTRFEHSIGVYHLAGRMLDKIMAEYPVKKFLIKELSDEPIVLTAKIAESIKIAALCHDIGHGPFSHIFDDILLANSNHPNRHHETRSCLIIQQICQRELHDVLTDRDIAFIKSVIDPKNHHCGAVYQIVSNNLNGIDVDKFDYLARDSKNLGVNISFNPNRLINEFIVDVNGNIAYPKHCSSDIYEMFHSRYMMHKKVYSHKTVKLLEQMLADIFVKVDPIFGISDSISDMNKFCQLTDDTIFNYIQLVRATPSFVSINLSSIHYHMINQADRIHQNIISRNLYFIVAETINSDNENSLEYFRSITEKLIAKYPFMSNMDFVTVSSKIGFVSGDKSDPFKSIYFYNKKENDHTFTVDKTYFSDLLNNKIQEQRWYLVCKKKHYQRLVTFILE